MTNVYCIVVHWRYATAIYECDTLALYPSSWVLSIFSVDPLLITFVCAALYICSMNEPLSLFIHNVQTTFAWHPSPMPIHEVLVCE